MRPGRTQIGMSFFPASIDSFLCVCMRLTGLTSSRSSNRGAIAEYPVQIEVGGKGLTSTRQVSSVAGSLNEAISYVLATRLRVATRQT